MTTRASIRRLGLLVWGLLAFVASGGASVALADLKTVDLPSEYTDFALNPVTGDLAAIDAERGMAVLILEKALGNEPGKPSESVSVGSTPVSICFKRFGDKSYYAIVCSQDSSLTLLHATDMTRAAKIQTNSQGSSLVFCSLNPADPFVYFAHGSGHDSRCSVIDLRDMSHVGVVFDSAMDAAVSASGQTAYRRGPWSPSGFTSLRLNNKLSDKKPEFQPGYSEHRGAAVYVPDPFDGYTANANVLHSADLSKKIATLNFSVTTFSAARPLVFGTAMTDRSFGGNSTKPIVLQAASCNSFQAIGEPVTLPAKFGTSAMKPLPRGVAGQADFKQVTSKTRYIADDQRQRLVCCSLNQVVLVPYAEFKFGEEPLLNVALKSAATAIVGAEQEFDFELADKQVSLSFIELPEGATATKHKVHWTPLPNQLGSHVIRTQLKSGDLERTQSFTVHAAQESFKLPIFPHGLALNGRGQQGVCWSISSANNGGVAEVELVTFDLVKRQVLAKKTESLRIQTALVDDKYVFLHEPNSSFIQVHDIATLTRVKTIYTEDNITRLALHRNDVLLALGQSRASAFNLSDFSRRKLPVEGSIELSSLGPIWGDVVLDDKLEKSRLLLQLPNVVTLGHKGLPSDPRSRMPKMLGEPRQIGTASIEMRPGLSPANAPYRAVVELQQPQNSARPESRLSLIIQDWVRGSVIQRIPIAERTPTQRVNRGAGQAIVAASPELAVVAWEDLLYPIAMPKPLPQEFKQGLTLRPDHSHLSLTEAKDGVLRLSHQATGGSGKKTFSLAYAPDGVAIDEDTGVVTVRTTEFGALINDALANAIPIYATGDPLEALKTYQQKANETLLRAIGRQSNSVPVALPIQVRVSDEDAQVSELRYVLLLESPSEPVLERLKKVHADAVSRVAEMKLAEATVKPGLPNPGDANATAKAITAQTEEVRRLRDKVETLESRVDLLTRQLGDLIKKLEQNNSGKK